MTADAERLAILVHEVRSPVAALAAVREALSGDRLARDDRQALIRLGIDACRGIDRVLSDVTIASVRLSTVDVVRLVEDSAAAATLAGPVVVRSSSDVPRLLLEVDPQRLRQALDNLVANAVAVSPPDAEVVVDVVGNDGQARISVTDRGTGVPAEQLERIFERGVQLDAERPGSGLGLAIARAIAEAHGGALTVESSPGKGATFTLTLGRSRSRL